MLLQSWDLYFWEWNLHSTLQWLTLQPEHISTFQGEPAEFSKCTVSTLRYHSLCKEASSMNHITKCWVELRIFSHLISVYFLTNPAVKELVKQRAPGSPEDFFQDSGPLTLHLTLIIISGPGSSGASREGFASNPLACTLRYKKNACWFSSISKVFTPGSSSPDKKQQSRGIINRLIRFSSAASLIQ